MEHHSQPAARDGSATTSPELSVIIPVLDEEGNIAQLCAEIAEALDGTVDYETIFVDDGSTDGTTGAVREAMDDPRVRLVRHARRAGQSAALRTGVKAARARWIATLDGDCQNDPADLIRLWRIARLSQSSQLIIGVRQRRRDTLVKRLSSRIANGVRRFMLSDDCPDSGCGIRIFERESFLDLPQFDHMHRFLPALFRAAGHGVSTLPVNHRERTRGESKYGVWDRLWVGIVDLFGVIWLRRRMIGSPPIASTGSSREESESAARSLD